MSAVLQQDMPITPIQSESKMELPMKCDENLTEADGWIIVRDSLPAIREQFPTPGRPHIKFTILPDGSRWWLVTATLDVAMEVRELLAAAEIRVMQCTQTLIESSDLDLTKVMLSRLRDFLSKLGQPTWKVWFDRDGTRQWFFRAATPADVQTLQDRWRVLEQECAQFLQRKRRSMPVPINKVHRVSQPAPTWTNDEFPTLGGVA
jgi:hypothetical protein